MNNSWKSILAMVALAALTACGEHRDWTCAEGVGEDTEFLSEIGCQDDFEVLASLPLDSSIPGSRSGKTVVDRVADGTLYFQNSNLYPTHYDFASTHLSGSGLPVVPMLAEFNNTEYSAASRRFLLGAITYYEGAELFAYEIAPYDAADADMIADAFGKISDHAFFGSRLRFHPTSDAVERTARDLPDSIRIVTTDELFAGVDFQSLNVAVSYGQVRFATAAQLEGDTLSFRDIAVLDSVPNDISVVMGIITAEFQTPLSHVNVLSRNRGTPNMALRGAYDDSELRALEGKWVRFEVTANGYSIEEVAQAEADAWWDENKPAEVQVPGLDLAATDLRDIEGVIDLDGADLVSAIKDGTQAFGGKAAHYSALSRVEGVPVPKAFAIPVFYYRQFMEQHGFDARVSSMIADAAFQNDPQERKTQLAALRADMLLAPVDASFEALLLGKLASDYPGVRMRFRSSTNAEDLEGFTGAGLYTSKSGDPGDPAAPVLDAVREVWASIWNYRAFEERSYRSIEHSAVGMAVLVHRSFANEEANGVALTNNPFDLSGLDPAFYINVQVGEDSVVQPEPGITTDQILYYYDRAGQPAVFAGHSNLLPEGWTVLSAAQLYELGQALDAIRSYFSSAYGGAQWWAMDVEFKFDGESGEAPALYVKQARPYGE